MYKAIIFDLDGTLLNTIDDICDSLNIALIENGFLSYTVEETKTFVGSGVRIMVERALHGIEHQKEDEINVLNGYLREYTKRQAIKTKPYNGVIDVIKELKNKGLMIGLLSNKPHIDTLKVVDNYFGLELFDIVLGQRDGVPIKPHPDALFEIINGFKLDKKECLFVGDSDVDMQTAINAVVDKVAVLWGFRTKEIIAKYHPNYFIKYPFELIKIVEEVR